MNKEVKEMIQFEYCKGCHEVFEITDNFGSREIASGMHKEHCSNRQ